MTTPSGHTEAIAASRVIGTSVYNTEGKSIGSIEDV
ncbi:PRC-barrel domain-containing protein, partial [Mesorhizobium humile]